VLGGSPTPMLTSRRPKSLAPVLWPACASPLPVGRGETPLARLVGDVPLVNGKDVVLIGRRDAAQPWYGHAALAASPILDISTT
jgi:hypothetical protein